MIVHVDGRYSLATFDDDVSAKYECGRVLTQAGPAADAATSSGLRTRVMVEIRRNLGGMIMRALVGGKFSPGGTQTLYEVCVAADEFDSGVPTTCQSRLGEPLVPGLPSDFAQSVLNGLTVDSPVFTLPPGTLRVDRAGYDVMGSSEYAFNQAAQLLRRVVAVKIRGGDIESAIQDGLPDLT